MLEKVTSLYLVWVPEPYLDQRMYCVHCAALRRRGMLDVVQSDPPGGNDLVICHRDDNYAVWSRGLELMMRQRAVNSPRGPLGLRNLAVLRWCNVFERYRVAYAISIKTVAI